MEYLRIKLQLNYHDEEKTKASIRHILEGNVPTNAIIKDNSNDIILYMHDEYYYNRENYIRQDDNIDEITTEVVAPEEVDNIDNDKIIVAICNECNGYIYASDDYEKTHDGSIICESCSNDYYFICDHCDEIYRRDEEHTTYDDAILCDYCYNHETFYCDDCEHTYYEGNTEHYHTQTGNTICENCRDNNYYTCENCDELIHCDDANYSDEDDAYYCNDCWSDRDDNTELLQEYHEHTRAFNDILTTGASDNLNETIGFELETEQGNSATPRHEYCKKIHDEINASKKHVHFERDGSLDNGVEIISEPMTLNYWNQEKNGIFKKLIELCASMNYRSHNGGNCGLHVHFNKKFFGNTEEEQQQKINTLLLFFETYRDEIIKLSRRERFGYCEFLSRQTYDLNKISDAKLRDKISKNLNFINKRKNSTGHSDAVNLNASTRKTFEIRIMRGTLKHETFVACIEFIINLIKCIQNEPLENISFSKVVNYLKTDYLKDYIKEREIKANYKKLRDTAKTMTKTIETLQKKLETNQKTITKTIKSEIDGRLKKARALTSNNINKSNDNNIKNIDILQTSVNNIKALCDALDYIERGNTSDARDVIRYNLNVRNNYEHTKDEILNKLEDIRDYKTALDLIS